MKDLTIIIPLKEYDSSMDELLNRAVESCADNKIILVGKGVEDYKYQVEDENEVQPTLEYLENNSDNTTYQHNVNIAVDKIDTKYFAVLEYDDYFSDIWFDNAEKYIEYDVEDTSAFLPLTEVIEYNEKDDEPNNTIGYSNEAFWASSFSDEIGCLDMESLQNYLSFNVSGAIFKTSDFISLGKLKESMKLVFWFEYLLRALHEQKRMFVIPKVGYYHFIGRKGCMMAEYEETMSEKEADWWVDLAKKEFFFKKDRNKVYEG